jgi:hypothetical protein
MKKIAIALVDPEKGEQTTQACADADFVNRARVANASYLMQSVFSHRQALS